jgi:peptidyl-prolyl cis-trans isomerase SurA
MKLLRSMLLGPCLSIWITCLVVPSLHAERELVDRVVAIVDSQAILLSDVLREMNLTRLQRDLRNLTEPEQEALFKKVLDDMINDQLLVAQAKVKGFEVGDQELQDAVDEAIRSIKQRIGSEEAYRAELERQGLTEAEVRDMHREQRRKQILASRVLQSELRSKISITDDQVEEFWMTHRDSLPDEFKFTPETVQLAHILTVPTTEDLVARVHARMDSIVARLDAGEDFATLAQRVSEWPTAQRGGDLGDFRYGDFGSDEFDAAVSKLQPGQTSPPFETRFGVMIVKLESRDGDVMRARHILLKVEPSENAQVEALERAQEIRRRVVAGENFEELARQYSDDPNSRDRGGVLENEWATDDLLPEFRAPIGALEVGGISDVVKSPNGFHVFKLLARNRSRETTLADVRDPLRRYLEQVELEKRFEAYVNELRKQFYVDIRV